MLSAAVLVMILLNFVSSLSSDHQHLTIIVTLSHLSISIFLIYCFSFALPVLLDPWSCNLRYFIWGLFLAFCVGAQTILTGIPRILADIAAKSEIILLLLPALPQHFCYLVSGLEFARGALHMSPTVVVSFCSFGKIFFLLFFFFLRKELWKHLMEP